MIRFEKSQIKRMLVATVISVGLFAITWFFYVMSYKEKIQKEIQSPIGFIRAIEGSHYIRPLGSVFWDLMQEGDAIFPNQELQMGDFGDLKIEFSADKTFLEIESQSNIKIKLNVTKNLEFSIQEGSFEVWPKQRNKYFLNIGENLSEISQPTSIFKTENDDVKTISLNEDVNKSQFGAELLSPITTEILELNPDVAEPFKLNFKIADPQIKVLLQWGLQRKQLINEVAFSAEATNSELLLPLGKIFFKWSIEKEGKLIWQTPIQKWIVKATYPPVVTFPANDQSIRAFAQGVKDKIIFKWNADAKFQSYIIELFEDLKGTKRITEDSVEGSDQFEWVPSKTGTFYWRLTGLVKSNQKKLKSKMYTFKVLPKEYEKVELTWKTDLNRKFKGPESSLKVNLEWTSKPSNVAKSFILKYAYEGESWEKNSPLVFKNQSGELNLPKAGTVKVLLEAMNNDGDSVGITKEQRFEMESVPLLQAPALTQKEGEVIKANGKGQVLLQWRSIASAQEYQIEIKGQDGKSSVFTTKKNEILAQKLLPGSHEYRVWGVDQYGMGGEKSQIGQISVPNSGSLKSPKIRKVEVQ